MLLHTILVKKNLNPHDFFEVNIDAFPEEGTQHILDENNEVVLELINSENNIIVNIPYSKPVILSINCTTEAIKNCIVNSNSYLVLNINNFFASVNVNAESLIINDTLVTNMLAVKVQNEFLLAEKVKTKILKVEANSFENEGEISSEFTLCNGKRLINNGELSSDVANLQFENYILNKRDISCNVLQVQSNFINLGGRVFAKHVFDKKGFVDLNVGLIAANNYSNSNLLNINLGLILPNFKTDLKYIFSFSNFASAARILIVNLLPEFSNFINLLFLSPQLLSVLLIGLTFLFKENLFTNLFEVSNLKTYDLMLFLNSVKDLSFLAISSYNSALALPNEMVGLKNPDLQNYLQNFTANQFYTLTQAKFSGLDLSSIGYSFLSLAGSSTEYSLLRLNTGANIAHHTTNYNVCNVNFGVDAAFTNNIKNNYITHNHGLNIGTEIYSDSETLQNSGALIGLNRFILRTNYFNNQNNALMYGVNNNISIKVINNQGKVYLYDGLVSVNLFNSEINSSFIFNNGQFLVNKANFNGESKLDNQHFIANEIEVADQGNLQITNSYFKTNHVHSRGQVNWKNSTIEVADTTHFLPNSSSNLENVSITSINYIDESNLSYTGDVKVSVKSFQHSGKVNTDPQDLHKDEPSYFYIDAPNALVLNGAGAFNNVYIKSNNYPLVKKFISGEAQFARYTVNNHLVVDTEVDFLFDFNYRRNADVTVHADSFTFANNFYSQRDFAIIANKGDVLFSYPVGTNSIYVETKKGAVYNNSLLSSKTQIIINSEGRFLNLGGKLEANEVGIKAKMFANVCQSSALDMVYNIVEKYVGRNQKYLQYINQHTKEKLHHQPVEKFPLPLGNMCIVNGWQSLFIESVEGNVINNGGVIRGENYTEILAQGNVVNLCRYENFSYVNGIIFGGAGINQDNVGLYIHAKGKVISDVADFISHGTKVIEADQGYEFSGRQQISTERKVIKRKWGRKKHQIETKIQVWHSHVHAFQGENLLTSKYGGFKSQGTIFSSPLGTKIYVNGDVEFQNYKITTHGYTKEYYLFGYKAQHEIHDHVIPNIFLNNGVTQIISAKGTIDARGAVFLGDNDIYMQADKKIIFGSEILKHKVTKKSGGVKVSSGMVNAFKSLFRSKNANEALRNTSDTYNKIYRVLDSNNGLELAANSVNLGIDLYNSLNGAMRGIANDTLSKELFSGVNAKFFTPTVTVTFTKQDSKLLYQTLSNNGVNISGKLTLKAGVAVRLENGVQIHAGGNILIDTPKFIAKAAELHSSYKQQNQALSLTFTLDGKVKDVGVAFSELNVKYINYQNAKISSDKQIYSIREDSEIILEGANIYAKTFKANKIKKLEIIDLADTTEMNIVSGSVSTSGQISGQVGDSSSVKTAKRSSVTISEGIDDNAVTIEHAHMKGGQLEFGKGEGVIIENLSSESVQNHSKKKTVGASLNVDDLIGLAEESKNETGEKAIPTIDVSINHAKKEERHIPYLDNKNNNVTIQHAEGEFTHDSNCVKVTNDRSLDLDINIPIPNASRLKNSAKNLVQGYETLTKRESEIPSPADNTFFVPPTLINRRRKFIQPEEGTDENLDDNKSPDNQENTKDKKQYKSYIPSIKFTKLANMVIAAANEQQQLGKVSQKTSKKLSSYLTKIFVFYIQEAAIHHLDYAMEKITEGLINSKLSQKIGIKSFVGTQKAVTLFAFNLVFAGLDGDKKVSEVLKDAVNLTLADISVTVVLKFIARHSYQKIDVGLSVLELIDPLEYDENFSNNLINKAIENFQEAKNQMNEGNWLTALKLNAKGKVQERIAEEANSLHAVANIKNQIADGFDYLSNQAFSFFSSSNQNQDDAINQDIINSSKQSR